MYLRQLVLQNVRCYTRQEFQFAGKVILLSGPNGSGKTTILETINLIAISKSFLPVGDHELTRHGATGYVIDALVNHDIGTPITITIEYNSFGGKKILTSATGPCSVQELIGLVPTVVLSTLHRELFIGEPAIRRAFVDRILSQSIASYKHALWRHRTALRQRNRLLSSGKWQTNELDAWTEELLESSIELVWYRRRFVEQFNRTLSQLVETTLLLPFIPALDYAIPWLGIEQSAWWNLSRDELRQLLSRRVATLLASDHERQTTQWGPQRDLLTFVIGTRPLHTVSSQGQQKMALFVAKLAEAAIIESLCDRAPILLLDDLFSDLDTANAQRIEKTVADLSHPWQVFITVPTTMQLSNTIQFQHIKLPLD